MKYPYYMLTTVYDRKLPNGKIQILSRGRILTASEAQEEGLHDGYTKESAAGDEYLDGFASLALAEEALQELQAS